MRFPIAISLPAFAVDSVPNFGHSCRYVVIACHCFNFHLADEIRYGAYFHMLICHLYVFEEVFVKIFGLFFNLFVFCVVTF